MSHMRVVWVDGIPRATVGEFDTSRRGMAEGGTAGWRAIVDSETAGRRDGGIRASSDDVGGTKPAAAAALDSARVPADADSPSRRPAVPPSEGESAPDLVALSRHGPVHFMGIAGAGMSALAEMLLRAGGRVTGCDTQPGETGEHLRSLGAVVVQGHDPAHVEHATAVVVTSAVPQDHPELTAARHLGMPVMKRARALGGVVNSGRLAAVAGTHGKTTTTAMTTEILAAAGLEPTGFVGGRVPEWGSGLRAGRGDLYVVEADEYDRSFLHLRPDAVAVTTVEADHLDVYGTLDAVENAFAQFVGLVRPGDDGGFVAACIDDAGTRRLVERIEGPEVLTYGTTPDALLRAVQVETIEGGSRFRVVERGEQIATLELAIPGLHNVRNALAAFALARRFGAHTEAAQTALARFSGVGRRFERLGDAGGITVVTDYAHHPTEIEATLAAARSVFPGRRLVAVFQPHLFTRTRDFADAFGRALAAADAAVVTDVYPAREMPIPGVTGQLVADATGRAGAHDVLYHATIETLPDVLLATLRRGDACIVMGAGNIDTAARALVRRLEARL